MDIDALRIELLAGHPGPVGNPGIVPYDVDDAIAAGQLNEVNRTLTRDTVSGGELLNATDDVEFGALQAANKNRWLALCGVDEINTDGGVAKSVAMDLFASGTATRANLVALKNPPASRAVEIGLGFVRPGNVNEARLE